MTLEFWVVAAAFVGSMAFAQYLYNALKDQRDWIDALLEDPKATLQALIDNEENE